MRAHLPEGTLLAIVHSLDGVEFVASATTMDRLLELVGDYVAGVAKWRLSPPTAERVRSLHEAGLGEAAVDLYFARMETEWDRERLVIVPEGPTASRIDSSNRDVHENHA